MIRPFTCLCILLAGGFGLWVYQSKHQAQLLDREIARTVKQADMARDRAGALRAEYMLLNDPTRLEALAGEHLASLKSTAPTQFATWTEFEKHLPPVGAPAVEAPPLEPEAPTAKLPVHPAKSPEPAAEPEATHPIATARPPAATPVAAVVAAASRPAQPPVAPRPAARPVMAPVSLTTSLPAALPQPASPQPAAAHPVAPVPGPAAMNAPAARPAARSMPTYTPPGFTPGAASTAEVLARITHGASVEPAVPAAASALGMARSMTPPPVLRTSTATAAIWQPGGSN
jgi:hypothetical protein